MESTYRQKNRRQNRENSNRSIVNWQKRNRTTGEKVVRIEAKPKLKQVAAWGMNAVESNVAFQNKNGGKSEP